MYRPVPDKYEENHLAMKKSKMVRIIIATNIDHHWFLISVDEAYGSLRLSRGTPNISSTAYIQL
jgi:hypothetical protein